MRYPVTGNDHAAWPWHIIEEVLTDGSHVYDVAKGDGESVFMCEDEAAAIRLLDTIAETTTAARN